MATFLADTVEDSQLDYQLGSVSKTRGGLVTGIAGDPATALEQCLDAVNAAGIPLGHTMAVGGINVIYRRLVVKPVSADTCRVQLVYDNVTGAVPTAFIIRIRTYEQAYQTDLIPGTRVPIHIPAWTNMGIPGVLTGDSSDMVRGDNVTFTFSRSITEYAVSGLRYGSTPPNYMDSVNKANSDNFLGRAAGWWKITEGATELSKYSGYYNFLLTAASKNDEDYSEIGILRNKITGHKIRITDADLALLLSPDYAFGIISTVNGGIRVGPYRTTNFASLFGFSTTQFGLGTLL